MCSPNQPMIAPFRIIADVGEAADGWQFQGLFDAAQPTRPLIVPIVYRRLDVADYKVDKLPLYFVRRHAKELASALTDSPDVIRNIHNQLKDLEANGASCLVVIEGNFEEIEEVLAADASVQASKDSGIPWLFVPDRKAAEMIVFAVIQRAWLHALKNVGQ